MAESLEKWRGDSGVGILNRDSRTAKAQKPSVKASMRSRLGQGQLGKEVHESRNSRKLMKSRRN
jgi:hypothetical protein